MIKKHGFDFTDILGDIKKKVDKSSLLPSLISNVFITEDLFQKYEAEYQNTKTVDYLYNAFYNVIVSKQLFNEEETQKINDEYHINNDFYEGFGI